MAEFEIWLILGLSGPRWFALKANYAAPPGCLLSLLEQACRIELAIMAFIDVVHLSIA